ncbi:MAG: hypothetical protein ACXVEF_15355 [Polyangiales bacterium]
MRWSALVFLIGCSRAEKETVPVVPTIFVAPSVSATEPRDPPRTTADVDAFVVTKRRGIRSMCWLPISPAGKTVYVMQVEIEVSGVTSKVTSVRADDPLVGACIVRMLTSFRYPRAEAKTVHTLTFAFP